ncbi:MAG: Nif3-like dinuclear metal center hexameric protein [Crocinitomicaceae bacterium]|nr:Nif3-like dinuclear metal center hexameric protein [Crocinitomicaceae bacterium]MBP6033151.1 Nif3-like dinuclear metal center hexameric protein [Crocinitomicaceae bacterium]
MSTHVKEIVHYLEESFPLSLQESYDNSGLICGRMDQEVQGVLLCLDSLEATVDEAIAKNCQLIIAHHPIIFKGLKKITGNTYVERVIEKCIQHHISLYAIHTNLDNHINGVNGEIANRLGLKNRRILRPMTNQLYKLVVFVPKNSLSVIDSALFQIGVGSIGNYSECHFRTEGIGTFMPNELANPSIGTKNIREEVAEFRVEYLVPKPLIGIALRTLFEAHPYEEVSHEIYPIENQDQRLGAGMIGELPLEMDALSFLKSLKTTFNCQVIRHTEVLSKPIKTVALCGGSGSFLLADAIRSKADIFVTGDFKYHEFFDAENHLIIADIGHFESEQFTPQLLAEKLKEKFTKFAVHLTDLNTNPINYL